jgi:hypothetical protein
MDKVELYNEMVRTFLAMKKNDEFDDTFIMIIDELEDAIGYMMGLEEEQIEQMRDRACEFAWELNEDMKRKSE